MLTRISSPYDGLRPIPVRGGSVVDISERDSRNLEPCPAGIRFGDANAPPVGLGNLLDDSEPEFEQSLVNREDDPVAVFSEDADAGLGTSPCATSKMSRIM